MNREYKMNKQIEKKGKRKTHRTKLKSKHILLLLQKKTTIPPLHCTSIALINKAHKQTHIPCILRAPSLHPLQSDFFTFSRFELQLKWY